MDIKKTYKIIALVIQFVFMNCGDLNDYSAIDIIFINQISNYIKQIDHREKDLYAITKMDGEIQIVVTDSHLVKYYKTNERFSDVEKQNFEKIISIFETYKIRSLTMNDDYIFDLLNEDRLIYSKDANKWKHKNNVNNIRDEWYYVRCH